MPTFSRTDELERQLAESEERRHAEVARLREWIARVTGPHIPCQPNPNCEWCAGKALLSTAADSATWLAKRDAAKDGMIAALRELLVKHRAVLFQDEDAIRADAKEGRLIGQENE